MKINKVLIVFKTHLDIGFTDYSNSVIEKYKKVFIPNAIKTADTLRKNKSSASFCWTTGSWLIYEYLRTASPENRTALEEAIKNGTFTDDKPYSKSTYYLPWSDDSRCRL